MNNRAITPALFAAMILVPALLLAMVAAFASDAPGTTGVASDRSVAVVATDG